MEPLLGDFLVYFLIMYPITLTYLFVYTSVYVCGPMLHTMHVKVRGQLGGGQFLYVYVNSWNWAHQTWQQAPSPTKPSCWPNLCILNELVSCYNCVHVHVYMCAQMFSVTCNSITKELGGSQGPTGQLNQWALGSVKKPDSKTKVEGDWGNMEHWPLHSHAGSHTSMCTCYGHTTWAYPHAYTYAHTYKQE